jgi:hypothetical protein
MNVFDLHRSVITDYRDFVRSFFVIADERAREFVDRSLVDEARLWPDPLLQVSPTYVRTETVDDLARRGLLHEQAAPLFRTADGHASFRLLRRRIALDFLLPGRRRCPHAP